MQKRQDIAHKIATSALTFFQFGQVNEIRQERIMVWYAKKLLPFSIWGLGLDKESIWPVENGNFKVFNGLSHILRIRN